MADQLYDQKLLFSTWKISSYDKEESPSFDDNSEDIESMEMSSSNLRYIFNLGNSIIGVGVLAMPYCFSQCGIILAIVLLCACNLLTRITCYLLMKSSQITRRKSFESLAFHTFGAMGKLMVEISIIGFLIGCLIAFFVVMGDLGPEVVTHLTGVEKSPKVRMVILVFLGIFVILPFSLLRKLDSLTIVSVLSIIFYLIFIVKILLQSLPNLWSGEWIEKVHFWNSAGLLKCLPIFAMALSCQTQFFEIYNIVPDPSVKKMSAIVTGAVNLCTSIYILVGVLGYISFYNIEIKGNLLTMFPTSLITEAIRSGFVLTVAVSFPLVIFPCRASIHSLLFGKSIQSNVIDTMAKMIPDNQFRLITIAIVFGTWIIGVLIPNIELVLGLNGSTVGTIICIILPTIMFIKIVTKNTNEKLLAQVVFGIGVFVMVASTYATLQNADKVAIKNLEKMEHNLLSSVTKRDSGNVVLLPVTVEVPKALMNGSVVASEIKDDTMNHSKKEPPVPVAPDVKKKEETNVEANVQKKGNGEKSKDEQLREKDAIIKKLAEHQEKQDQVIEKQMELLKDMHQHQEVHEELEKKLVDKVVKEKVDVEKVEVKKEYIKNPNGKDKLPPKVQNVSLQPKNNKAAKRQLKYQNGNVRDQIDEQKIQQLHDVALPQEKVLAPTDKNKNVFLKDNARNVEVHEGGLPKKSNEVKQPKPRKASETSNDFKFQPADIADPAKNLAKDDLLMNNNVNKGDKNLKMGADERIRENVVEKREIGERQVEMQTEFQLENQKQVNDQQTEEQDEIKVAAGLKNEMRKLHDGIPNNVRNI